MVGNVTIQGQITGTATFDGAKISAVVTVSPPINATVVFGKSGVSIHNELTGRGAVDVHPKESITGLGLTDSPEFANTQITTLDSVENGGVIPNVEATWLGATAKSILSYLQKLVSKVYAINSRVAVLENNVILDVTLAVDTVNVTLTLSAIEEHIIMEYGSINGMNNNDLILSNCHINGVLSSNYVVNASRFSYVPLYTGRYSFFGTLEIRRINGYLYIFSNAQQIYGNVSSPLISSRSAQCFMDTPQQGVNLIGIEGSYKAGTRFIIKRIK